MTAFDAQIASQPDAVEAVLDAPAPPRLDPLQPLVFTGLGTSLHAARVAAAWAGFPAAAIDSHDLALRLPVPPAAQVVVITHGGRGPLAKAVLAKARAAGARTFAVVGQGAPEPAADFVLRTCPQERAETHSVSYLTALAVLARMLGIDVRPLPRLLLDALAAKVEGADLLAPCDRLLVAGLGLDAITAEEAALKLKEATFKWAQGLGVEQALHGPQAALAQGMGAILIPAPQDEGGRSAALRRVCLERGVRVVEPRIEPCPEPLRPFLGIVPLQRLTAEIARLCGGDPDRSRPA